MKYPSKAKEAIRATEMSPVTLAEALSLQDTQRKYGNEKVVINGQTFDSQAEYRRWRELCLMAQAGEIGDLQRQVRYELVPVQRDEDGNVLERACFYVADFVYTDADALLPLPQVHPQPVRLLRRYMPADLLRECPRLPAQQSSAIRRHARFLLRLSVYLL